jgi:hypothetical protein
MSQKSPIRNWLPGVAGKNSFTSSFLSVLDAENGSDSMSLQSNYSLYVEELDTNTFANVHLSALLQSFGSRTLHAVVESLYRSGAIKESSFRAAAGGVSQSGDSRNVRPNSNRRSGTSQGFGAPGEWRGEQIKKNISNDDGNNESDDETPAHGKDQSSQVRAKGRLSCPFYKHNPRRHNGRSCIGPGWWEVHRVK